MHQSAMICMCEHEARSQIYTSQNIRLPHLPTRAYMHALTSIKWMYWPHNLHQHLLWPFPDAHKHRQNVETECAQAVISNCL